MSRARHKARASGGKVTAYAGGDSNVMKEARERNTGGNVMGEGDKAKARADKRARGGATPARATGGAVSTPGRKRGGGIGADKKPLSSAASIKLVTKGEIGEDAKKSD